MNVNAAAVERYRTILTDHYKSAKDTPVHWAILQNNEAIFKKKIDLSTHLERCSGEGYAVLSESEREEHADEEYIFHINWPSNFMEITPLMVCAMLGNYTFAVLLINTGKCDLSKQDANGYTALHHAAIIGHSLMVAFLLSKGSPVLPNGRGATYLDLQELCYPTIDPAQQRFWYKTNAGDIVEGDGVQFKTFTHATLLTKENIVTGPELIRQWIEDEEVQQDPFPEELRQIYDSFVPRQVYMENHPVAGWILRAGENIPKGVMVGEYLGLLDKESLTLMAKNHRECIEGKIKNIPEEYQPFVYLDEPRFHYGISTVDAFTARGMMALAASSFPNMVSYSISGKKVDQRVIFISTRAIRAGEPLTIDYGEAHEVKRMPYVELNEEKLLAYFAPLKATPELITKHLLSAPVESEDLNSYSERVILRGYVHYVLTTPTAFMLLVLKGGWDPAVFREAEKAEQEKYDNLHILALSWGKQKHLDFNRSFSLLVSEMNEVGNEEKKEQFTNELLELVGKKDVSEIVRRIEEMRDSFYE